MMPMKRGFEPVRSSLYRDAKEEAYMPHGRFTHTLADEAVTEATERGEQIYAVRDPGFLEGHAVRMAKMRAETEQLAKRIETMADRVFGPCSMDGQTGCPATPAGCHVVELGDIETSFRAALTRADIALERLERL